MSDGKAEALSERPSSLPLVPAGSPGRWPALPSLSLTGGSSCRHAVPGTSVHTGTFAAQTVDSFFLGRSLNIIKCLLCTCQTLSYEVFRKLEDTKQNVIS